MGNRLSIISPDGRRASVDEENLDKALQMGFVLSADVPAGSGDELVAIIDPSGRTAKVPRNNIDKALALGFQLAEDIAPEEPQGDSWPSLIGKSALKGLGAIADLPRGGVESLQNIVNQGGLTDATNLLRASLGDREAIESSPQLDIAKYVPSTSDAREALKNYTGVDLEPHPTTGAQRVVGNAAEFAGGISPFSLPTKGVSLGKNLFDAFKQTGAGATLGGTSGLLQEGGVNPLLADLGTSLALPGISASSKNLFNKFSPSHNNLKTEAKVANALREQIGEENVGAALENIQKYKRQDRPINVQLTTPELAQDVGLSRLYRSQSNLKNLPQVHEDNQAKLLEALQGIGTTGLEDSVKGDMLRGPFIEQFARKKARRTKLTEPLYDELKAIQEGIDPTAARNLLTEEISVASPNVQAPLEKYLNNLNRNNTSPQQVSKTKELRTTLANVEKEYAKSHPYAIAQLKEPVLKELAMLENSINPLPIQLENTIQELGDKVNSLSRQGEYNSARRFGNIKKAYEQDLSKNPSGLKHRSEYARLSKPVNEIETSPLLNSFVKENKDINKLEGLIAPSEKIPSLVLKADLPNTKLLVNKSKHDPNLLNTIKGIYIDDLIKKTTLSSGNLSYDKANKFLNKEMKGKVDLVFNNKEKKVLNQFLDSLERKSKIQTKGNIDGNSNTFQKLQIASEFNSSLGSLGKLAEKTALKGAGIGSLGEVLLSTGKDVFNSVKNRKYNNALERALVEPSYFKKLMTNDLKPKTIGDFYKVPKGAIPYSILSNRGDQ